MVPEKYRNLDGIDRPSVGVSRQSHLSCPFHFPPILHPAVSFDRLLNQTIKDSEKWGTEPMRFSRPTEKANFRCLPRLV